MSYARRMFISNSNVMITSRIKHGLPFACNSLIELIIKSTMARAQAIYPVKITHFIFMGNHFHILAYVQSSEVLVNFIAYLKKQLADFINHITGKSGSRWQCRFDAPTVIDPEKALALIIYIYTNPVRANLVESIYEYPGVSSLKALQSLDSVYTEEIPRVRIKDLPCLKNNPLNAIQIDNLVKKLSAPYITRHQLKIHPYLWAKAFDETKELSNDELKELILINLSKKESELKALREFNKETVLGCLKLKAQSIFKKHRPKHFGRRMVCLSSSKELRRQYITRFKSFCKKAYSAYQSLKNGERASFPLGCFRPAAPPLGYTFVW